MPSYTLTCEYVCIFVPWKQKVVHPLGWSSVVIEFLVAEGCPPKAIHTCLKNVCETIDISNIQRWVANAKKLTHRPLQISVARWFCCKTPQTVIFDNFSNQWINYKLWLMIDILEHCSHDDSRAVKSRLGSGINCDEPATESLVHSCDKAVQQWLVSFSFSLQSILFHHAVPIFEHFSLSYLLLGYSVRSRTAQRQIFFYFLMGRGF